MHVYFLIDNVYILIDSVYLPAVDFAVGPVVDRGGVQMAFALLAAEAPLVPVLHQYRDSLYDYENMKLPTDHQQFNISSTTCRLQQSPLFVAQYDSVLVPHLHQL